MRVLIWKMDSVPGGHRVQADKTAQALARVGVEVTIASKGDIPLDGFDVVHGIGADPGWFRRVRQAGIPIVMSTIYWNRRYVLGFDGDLTRRNRLLRAARIGHSVARRGMEATAARITAPIIAKQLAFESVDLLLPNSAAEAQSIREELSVSTPTHIVPNGVDADVFVMPLCPAPRSGVLYVGRVEPHKNQLGLIKALGGSGIDLKIVGPVHPDHHDYMQACRRIADQHTEFIPERSQQQLVELYQRAAVHVIPSWFETTGLVSLEACLCGAAVVTTDRGYAREYLGAEATYCHPGDPRNILAAVRKGLAAGGSPRLRERVLSNYTWMHTATETLVAYEKVTGSRSSVEML